MWGTSARRPVKSIEIWGPRRYPEPGIIYTYIRHIYVIYRIYQSEQSEISISVRAWAEEAWSTQREEGPATDVKFAACVPVSGLCRDAASRVSRCREVPRRESTGSARMVKLARSEPGKGSRCVCCAPRKNRSCQRSYRASSVRDTPPLTGCAPSPSVREDSIE